MQRVVIIGAGAAGLSAARELARSGVEIVVLEARDRIGGRVFTIHDSPVPVELGAEFVHGSHPAIMNLLEVFEIPFFDVTEHHWYFEDGEVLKSHEFFNKLTATMDLMSLDQPDGTFAEFLHGLPDDPATQQAKRAASLYVEGFHAARVERIGIHGLVKANEAEEEIDGQHSFRIPNGYDHLLQAVYDDALKYGATLHLNTTVKEIRWGRQTATARSGRVEVVCQTPAGEQVFSGSQVLITLPLGVLQLSDGSNSIQFVPELPPAKRKAIEAIPMGQAIRVVLHFRERFWERLKLKGLDESEDASHLGFIHSPDCALPTWWTLLPEHAHVLVGWTGGTNAEELASLNAEELLGLALSSLEDIFGIGQARLRKLLISFHHHDWSADPFTRGAYAYLPVGGLELQQQLAQPVDDVLFFAGEAMSVGHIGTVHGAIDTGQRAAREILESVESRQ